MERTETVVLEIGKIALKIVASYRLSTAPPKQRMRMRSAELGEIEAQFEGIDAPDYMPRRLDAAYTLRLSNIETAETLELQLGADQLLALQEAIGKVTASRLIMP